MLEKVHSPIMWFTSEMINFHYKMIRSKCEVPSNMKLTVRMQYRYQATNYSNLPAHNNPLNLEYIEPKISFNYSLTFERNETM